MWSRRAVMAGAGAAAVLPGMLRAEDRVFKASVALEGARVLVAVGINGKGPYIFMIDTGAAASLIRDDLATEVKLPIASHTRFGGVGGRDIYPVYQARDFVIGGTLRQSNVVLVGAGNLNYGPDIRGALAAGILTAQDSQLDFDKGELRIFPDGWHGRDGYTELPSNVRHSGSEATSAYIFATASVNGQPLTFLLDTGAPPAVSLFPSGARKTGLWDASKPYAPRRPGGIGGEGPVGRIVRADSIDFGGIRLDRPLIPIDDRASSAADVADGLIGLALLRRFNLGIDARRGRLWVQPSHQPTPPEARYPYSGIWLDHKGDAAVVAGVGTGSPAAEAGIAVGDRIVGEWNAALRSVNGRPGVPVTVTVERGGTKREVALTPRLYL